MRALVKTANKPNCMEIREIEKPVPRDHELLIRVLGAGVCGTDLQIRITHRLPSEDGEKAFDALEGGKGVKAVLRPQI